jgi:hypothetical protein
VNSVFARASSGHAAAARRLVVSRRLDRRAVLSARERIVVASRARVVAVVAVVALVALVALARRARRERATVRSNRRNCPVRLSTPRRLRVVRCDVNVQGR